MVDIYYEPDNPTKQNISQINDQILKVFEKTAHGK